MLLKARLQSEKNSLCYNRFSGSTFLPRKSTQNFCFLCKALLFNGQATHRTSKQTHKTIYTKRNLFLQNIKSINQNNTEPVKQ